MTDRNRHSEHLLEIVDKAKALGCRTLSDGTQVIGHVPHVGPEAWLHIVFRPLAEVEVEASEEELGRRFPEDFRSFLLWANGFSLFSGSLAVFGRRVSYERRGDVAYQPFNIVTPNKIERPASCPASAVFVGAYKWDGSLLYIDEAARVYRCDRDSGEVFNEWEGFWPMLALEAQRLSSLFDQSGKPLKPSLPTTPNAHEDRGRG